MSDKRHNIITVLIKMGSLRTKEFKDVHDIHTEFKIAVMCFHFFFLYLSCYFQSLYIPVLFLIREMFLLLPDLFLLIFLIIVKFLPYFSDHKTHLGFRR